MEIKEEKINSSLIKDKKWLLLVIIIGIVVMTYSLSKDYNSIIQALKNINIYWFLVAITISTLTPIISGFVLKDLCDISEVKMTFIDCLKLSYITPFFNAITPFAAGGQPVQVYYLRKKSGENYGKLTSIIMQNFIIWQIAMFVYYLVIIIFNMIFLKNSLNLTFYTQTMIIVGVSINLLAIAFVMLTLRLPIFSKKLSYYILKFLFKIHLITTFEERLEKVYSYIDNIYENQKIMSNNKKRISLAILYTVLQLSLGYSISFFVAKSLGLNLSFYSVQIASVYVGLISSFAPTPGSSGAAEIVFLLMFRGIVNKKTIFAIMLLWRFITYYYKLTISFIITIIEMKKLNKGDYVLNGKN